MASLALNLHSGTDWSKTAATQSGSARQLVAQVAASEALSVCEFSLIMNIDIRLLSLDIDANT